MATTLTVDLTLDPLDTVPALEYSTDDGVYALSIGNGESEVRLIGDTKTLTQLIDNCRQALDSLQYCRPANRVSRAS